MSYDIHDRALIYASFARGFKSGGVQNLPTTAEAAARPFNPEHVKTVVDGMYGVVNENGTGTRARLPNIEICGKTGTSQLASYDYINSVGKGIELRENAWFEAFAPRENPEIVVVAFFEHGRHGPAAAAIARDVLKAYFDKKIRLEAMKQTHPPTTAGLSLGLPGAVGQALPLRPPAF